MDRGAWLRSTLTPDRIVEEKVMRRAYVCRSALVLLVATGACDGPFDVPPAALPMIQTGANAYRTVRTDRGFRPSQPIEYRVENRASHVVFLRDRCGHIQLDRREGGRWVPAWQPGACLLVLQRVIRLEPGEDHIGEIEPLWVGDIAPPDGEYRLRFMSIADRDWDPGDPHVEFARPPVAASNAFRIVLSR